MFKLVKGVISIVAVLVIAACDTASATPPVAVSVNLASDTVKVSVLCPVAAPNTGCLLTMRDSVSNTVLFTNTPMAVGGTYAKSFVCSAPGASVVILASMQGTAPGVAASASSSARATGTCPLPSAVTPTFTIQLNFVSGP